MYVATCRAELLLEDVDSLKDKRRVLKSIIDGARRRFNVAIVELV